MLPRLWLTRSNFHYYLNTYTLAIHTYIHKRPA